MGLIDTLAYDAINTFITDFAEPITYVPYQGAPVEMLALVYREPATAISGLTGAIGYKHEVFIANDPTAGITVVNKGKDKVILTNSLSATAPAETFVVLEIIQNDQGIFRLGVGA